MKIVKGFKTFSGFIFLDKKKAEKFRESLGKEEAFQVIETVFLIKEGSNYFEIPKVEVEE